MSASDKLLKAGWLFFFLIAGFVLLVIFLLAQYFYLGSASGKIHVGMSRGQVRGVLRLCAERRVAHANYPASVHAAPGISVYSYDMPCDASDALVWVVYDSKGNVVQVWDTD